MRTYSILLMLFAGLLFTACGDKDNGADTNDQEQVSENGTEANDTDEPVAEAPAAEPEMVDGAQVIVVTVADTGYSPSRIKLKEGVPARIVFDQKGTTECSAKVKISDFGVAATDLPKGQQTTVEFTPDKSGTFNFTCGMDMLKGTLLVEEGA